MRLRPKKGWRISLWIWPKNIPRSVHEKLYGLVQISRTIDKGKAAAGGTLSLLGIDHGKFLDIIKNARSDEDIHAYTKTFIENKSPEEIERWNQDWISRRPQGEESTDVTTWADLLNLDEKRAVLKRETVSK
jgi:hypothetical protein